MDLKQLEYIIKIAEENNITRAAQKLFITQSALNQQLLKLERELGTPLFCRSRTDWHLTEAGEIYIENAREILKIKKNTYNQISDIAGRQKGQITVGLSPGRGVVMFSSIYPVFHQKYPHITVNPIETGVKKQHEMLARGDIDLGFVTLNEKQKLNFTYIPLYTEEILLGIPKDHPLGQLAAAVDEPYAVMELSRAAYEPFVIMYKESTTREIEDMLFKEAGISPNILFETSSASTIVTMIEGKICCGLIPEYYARHSRDIACFSLPSHPTWEIAACYKKGTYINNPAKEFIRLAGEFWNSQLQK